jgi:hypothetical protein
VSDVTPMCKGCEKLFALLTAERADHAKEVADLQQRNARLEDFAWACVAAGADIRKRIAELEAQLHDEREE